MSADLAPVCILAGGRGTRLGASGPKALVEVAGRPFLFHQLALLRSHGARQVVLCVGHQGELIEAAVGDGSGLGLEVGYAYDSPQLDGTAGALRGALPLLGEEFLVLYGDTYLRIDYGAVLAARRWSGLPALLTVLRNQGRWDTSNTVYTNGMVSRHDKRTPRRDMEWIDYGLSALTPDALNTCPDAADLSTVYGELARRGRLAGYEATERFYEIGSLEALRETDAFLRDHVARSP